MADTGISAGHGRIDLNLHGKEAVFKELSYKYPLKLLSPRLQTPAVAIAYILTYGGGLVSGDYVHLDVKIDSGATLMLLTQGSTKVFKFRPRSKVTQNASLAVSPSYGTVTVQKLVISVETQGLLLLLPDPVTCFADAAYNQVQTFRLELGASAVLLDWLTAGRVSRGEEWQFARYSSINEVWEGTKRVARDAVVLERAGDGPGNARSLKERLGVYSCYATIMLYGPVVKGLILDIAEARLKDGCVVRVAAIETELVKTWLRNHLRGLENIVGVEVYSRAFV